MTNILMYSFQRYFIVWFVALVIFSFLEWRHPGFVSFVFPFPVLILVPGLIILAGYACEGYCKTYISKP